MDNKTIPTLALALILFGLIAPLLVAITAPTVEAARGGPQLAAVQCDLTKFTCTNIKLASYNVSIRAGDVVVAAVDNDTAYAGWYFALVFRINDTWLVSFDGAWFDLVISKDGYSAFGPEDITYARGFRVVDLLGSPKNVTIENPVLLGGRANFTIGKFTIAGTDYYMVVGPVPFDITPLYKYIKVFDGIASQVAVSQQTLVILPSVAIEPTRGPPGREVVVKGVALLPNELVNISYIDAK
ncbi:MAG: hypothetical protein ACP5KA_02290, partial [Desulfurococcaceae archaeon]